MNTKERIEKILEDIFVNKYDQDIIKNVLEALILKAKLEQLNKEK